MENGTNFNCLNYKMAYLLTPTVVNNESPLIKEGEPLGVN